MTPENQHMRSIKQMVQDDQYRVDPHAVADAILHRVRMCRAGRMPSEAQNLCSKPESSSPRSPHHTPGWPSTTDPIRVRPALG